MPWTMPHICIQIVLQEEILRATFFSSFSANHIICTHLVHVLYCSNFGNPRLIILHKLCHFPHSFR
ncbi:hypothetical protein HOLleu_12921 [Holothuria leucospilota]|uniref:Uncharacterized protein n=1 Tax=Holothuria leucospilota TaxID=206669 RepID=A0A9Q1HDF8_HOLLE|nr:hypothetical protein HOLleu_12921 [Holothuria leucospilota]